MGSNHLPYASTGTLHDARGKLVDGLIFICLLVELGSILNARAWYIAGLCGFNIDCSWSCRRADPSDLKFRLGRPLAVSIFLLLASSLQSQSHRSDHWCDVLVPVCPFGNDMVTAVVQDLQQTERQILRWLLNGLVHDALEYRYNSEVEFMYRRPALFR
jgi:hypothetical protein